MKANIRLLLLMAAAALLLSACRTVVKTEVKSDGSGELRTAVVFTAKERDDFTQKPENKSKSICDNIEKDIPANASFVEEIHDGETFCVTERSFSNLAELRKFYAGMGQVKVNTLQFELGKFTLDVDVDLSNTGDGKGIANEWQLTLPGEIVTQNADRVEGQTLIWVVSPGEKAHLHAESAAGLNPATLGMVGVLILAGILALALVGGLAVFLLLRRKS